MRKTHWNIPEIDKKFNQADKIINDQRKIIVQLVGKLLLANKKIKELTKK